MTDCVILINDRLVSLSHMSLLLTQTPTSPSVDWTSLICRIQDKFSEEVIHTIRLKEDILKPLKNTENNVDFELERKEFSKVSTIVFL